MDINESFDIFSVARDVEDLPEGLAMLVAGYEEPKNELETAARDFARVSVDCKRILRKIGRMG